MNKRTTAPGAIALAAFLLGVGAACGSEITPPSQDLGGAEQSSPTQGRPTGWPDCFNGSADAAERMCRDTADTTSAPDDFRDNYGGIQAR